MLSLGNAPGQATLEEEREGQHLPEAMEAGYSSPPRLDSTLNTDILFMLHKIM